MLIFSDDTYVLKLLKPSAKGPLGVMLVTLCLSPSKVNISQRPEHLDVFL